MVRYGPKVGPGGNSSSASVGIMLYGFPVHDLLSTVMASMRRASGMVKVGPPPRTLGGGILSRSPVKIKSSSAAAMVSFSLLFWAAGLSLAGVEGPEEEEEEEDDAPMPESSCWAMYGAGGLHWRSLE